MQGGMSPCCCIFKHRVWQHRQFYSYLDTPHPQPLEYEAFKIPLEKGAVRLGILQPPPALSEAASKAAAAIQAILPPGMLLFTFTPVT